MPKLNIGGQKVTVGDEFLSLSPDQQQATVDEIAGQLGITAAPGTSIPERGGQRFQFAGGRVSNPRAEYEERLQAVRQSQFPDMNDEQWADYSQRAFAPYDLHEQGQHSQLFGLTDEMNAGLGALGSQARQWTGAGGPGFGEAFDQYKALEESRRDIGRDQNGNAGALVEFAGAMSSLGPRALKLPGATNVITGQAPRAITGLERAAKAGTVAGVQGGIYGAGGTDGDLGERAQGALAGFGMGAALGSGASLAGNAIGALAGRSANKAAMRQAVASSPSAQLIKDTGRAHFKAAENSGAVVSQPAVNVLASEMRNLARAEGLTLPNGQLSGAFPKVAHAMSALEQYAQSSLSMAQAKTLRKTMGSAAKSADPDERRLGALMLDELDDFMEALQPGHFVAGNGKQAVREWAQGRSTWARGKRTETIEALVDNARMANGGFEAGLRQGFKSLLTSDRKRRGFSKADLAAMRAFVDGGRLDALLKKIGGGAGWLGGGIGFAGGGLPAALAVPLIGAGARRVLNQGAERTAKQVRAQVALPGGLPRAMPRLVGPNGGRAEIGLGMGVRGALPLLIAPNQRGRR